MKRLLSNDLSTSPTTKILAINTNEEEMTSNINNSTNLNNGHPNSDSNEAKKARIEKSPPSRVVHLRNIDASELDIVQFGLTFGKITNVLNLRKKNQAFLEFDNIEHAQAMTDYFSSIPILLNGRQIFVQFSNHQELKTDPNNANNQQAQAALQSATILQEIGQTGGQNCVLRVVVNNMIYPVNVDTFYQIFSKFGVVLKIITFTKNDKFQGLIQMKDATTAQSVKLNLNGQNIYNGCCTLQIDFSKLHSLNVKYNNDKSRDYTNPILPSSENSNEPISIGARYLAGIPNVYGSPIMTLAGAPLTTLSAMNNGAIHFPTSTAAMFNASQLASQYTTAIACQNPATTLLTTTGTNQSPLSLSTLQQQQHHHQQHHHHHHPHAANTSPYILLSASSSDEVCGNGGGGGTRVGTGKNATLSSPSALYFYNNNNTTPTIANSSDVDAYRECLQCSIKFSYTKLIDETLNRNCSEAFECIEFEFNDRTLFENFFSNYVYIFKNLYNKSSISNSLNSLHITITHNNYEELNLTYIKSILKPNGTDYFYLSFSLNNNEKPILLDFQTDNSSKPLISIRINIICDDNNKNTYDIGEGVTPIITTNSCVIIKKNNSRKISTTIQTSTQDYLSKTNLFLFIGGIIVFSIWILCICLCLYLRYYKWKNDNNFNQRSSIVSSMFSTDTYDTRQDDILFSQQKNQKSKQIGQYGLYSYDNDF
ncbi:unnamed protein product [Adineta steineri]|uniref:RRM domain-containing protein n=1 Tax=Adineta steineri TaxID=433720 RepID=A0A818Y828_9BILA|nr:unnamed protein product [Adineta steineri]